MHHKRLVVTVLRLVAFLHLSSPIDAASLKTHESSALAVFEPHRKDNGTESCGIKQLSFADWNGGFDEVFSNWTDHNWDNYKQSNYTTFIDYLRSEFAPEAAPSAMMCDGVGTCTIGSCENLAKDLTQVDRQMAYYAFEQISNIHHTYQVIYQASFEVSEHLKAHHRNLVKVFTHAIEIETANSMRFRMNQIITTTVATIAAVLITAISGLLALPMVAGALADAEIETSAMPILELSGVSKKNLAALKITNSAVGFVSSVYNTATMLTALFSQAQGVVDDVDHWFENMYADVTHNSVQQVWQELYGVMEGKNVVGPASLPELLKSGIFVQRAQGLRQRLTKELTKTHLGQAINTLWTVDRSYILDTNVEGVPCEADVRGPKQNRVCLPERSDRVYWIYSIHRGEEMMNNRYADVRGPAGLKRIEEDPETWHNITKQDIVRSSLWIHEQNAHTKDLAQMLPALGKELAKPGPQYHTNTVFSLPICRNPGGEAISSVRSSKGKNYPCMCGEFAWNKGWSPEKDETPLFLARADLWDSRTWRKFCKQKRSCKRDKKQEIKWPQSELPKGAKTKLKYAFKSCKYELHAHRGKLRHGKTDKET